MHQQMTEQLTHLPKGLACGKPETIRCPPRRVEGVLEHMPSPPAPGVEYSTLHIFCTWLDSQLFFFFFAILHTRYSPSASMGDESYILFYRSIKKVQSELWDVVIVDKRREKKRSRDREFHSVSLRVRLFHST
jgi:hypothetical protein